jgi:hypothetical protein
MIARPDQEKIDIAHPHADNKTPDPKRPGAGPTLTSVNLSQRVAYQPPDFRRAAAVPLYGSPKVSPPPGELGP